MRINPFYSVVKSLAPAALCLAVCAPVFTSCSEDEAKEIINSLVAIEGTYTESTNFSGVHTVEGSMIIEDGVVTIEPGTVINFKDKNSRIIVREKGALKMVGTPEKPITLTSTNIQAGAWGGIEIHTSSVNNIMDNVNIINGGSGSGEDDAAVYVAGDARLSVTNTVVEGSLANGFLFLDCYVDKFDGNKVANCKLNPIRFINDFQNSLPAITADNTYLLNGEEYIRLGRYTGNVDKADLTIRKISIPYLADDIRVDGKTLTIEAGATIVFMPDRNLRVSESGTLKAVGAEKEPIILTGKVTEKASWYGIVLNTPSPNVLKYVTIINAGGDSGEDEAAVYVGQRARVSVENCFVENSFSNGFCFEDAIVDVFAGNNISGSGAAPIKMIGSVAEVIPNLGEKNSYLLNKNNYIHLARYTDGVATDNDIVFHNQGIPYRVEGLKASGSHTLTIEPGVVFEFTNGAYVQVSDDAKIVAVGTEKEPIVFKNAIEDDYWPGIEISSHRAGAAKFVNCNVMGAGVSNSRSYRSAFLLGYAGVLSLENVTISNCRYYGFEFEDAYSKDMEFSQKNVKFLNCKNANILYNDEQTASAFAASYPMPE